MATKFKINEYAGTGLPRQLELSFNDTVQGQSDSVRGILQRFAREGVVSSSQSKEGQFAAQFSDDIPLDSETVDRLMEMDDLSGMDEMEIKDYVRENTEIFDSSKINNSSENRDENLSTDNSEPGNNEVSDNQ